MTVYSSDFCDPIATHYDIITIADLGDFRYTIILWPFLHTL